MKDEARRDGAGDNRKQTDRELTALTLELTNKTQALKNAEEKMKLLTLADREKAEYIRILNQQHELETKTMIESGRKEISLEVQKVEKDIDRLVCTIYYLYLQIATPDYFRFLLICYTSRFIL